jgi:hypothetical protein
MKTLFVILATLWVLLMALAVSAKADTDQEGAYIYGHNGVYAAVPESLVREVMADTVSQCDKWIQDCLDYSKSQGFGSSTFSLNEGKISNWAAHYICTKYPTASAQAQQYLTYVAAGTWATEFRKKLNEIRAQLQ